LHLYLQVESVPPALRTHVPCFQTRGLRMHVYPWSSFGHEIAHFVTYCSLGGRAMPILEEAIARYFGDVFLSPHSRVIPSVKKSCGELGRRGVRQGARDWLRNGEGLSREDPRTVSFTGYLLTSRGRDNFRRLWKHRGPLMEALGSVYHQSPEELVEQWVAFLCDCPDAESAAASEVLSDAEWRRVKPQVEAARIFQNRSRPIQGK
jgi:hypothetical protein